MEPRTSYTFVLTPGQQQELSALLQTGNYRPCQTPHAILSAETDACRIAIFPSSKCLVQGKGAADFVAFVLEPLVLKAARLGYETILSPDLAKPHIGVDESGKGDFFGPLVTASAYIDQALLPPLQALGVRDSKQITSDKRLLEMARDIRNLLGARFSIVAIGPTRYNSLYARMRSVNSILAWAHARSIENLLEKVPDCPRAISDQFGNQALVLRALMRRGRRIELVQRHRAESDPAVAAASVLARAAFLHALSQMQQQYGQAFPKGASPAVIEAARRLAADRGPGILLETAKCHFKTADTVLAQCGASRSSLGPDGAAVSRPAYRHRRGGSSEPNPAE